LGKLRPELAARQTPQGGGIRFQLANEFSGFR
jgi:hypothetical protein